MNQTGYLKEFVKYAALNVLGMLGLSCYILADTFFVANGLGADGLAALNLAIPIYSFVHGSGLMLGMGGATRYSILKAHGEQETVNRLFTGTLRMAVLLALIYVFIGLTSAHWIAGKMGGEGQVLTMAATYLRVILLFAPAFMLNDVFICFVRNDGDPRLSMLAMLGGSLLNIVLDYVFIFPFGMGIFGAVLATGLAPVFSLCVLSLHRVRRRSGFHLSRRGCGLKAAGTVVSLGVPSLVAEVSSGVVIIVFNTIILGLHGNVGVAAYGVIANLSLVATAVYTGIAQGSQPLFSRAYGQGDVLGLKRTLFYGITAVGIVSAALYAGVFLFAGEITAVFNSEGSGALQSLAVPGLKLYFLAVFFVGFNLLSAMYFAATEKARPAQIISVARGLVVIIPMAFFLSSVWGMNGVWLSYPVTEALVFAAAAFMLASRRRERPSRAASGETRS